MALEDPWGILGAPGGALGSLGGRCKPLKNACFIVFSALEGPEEALEGPWGVAGGLGAPSMPWGSSQESLGGPQEVGGLKARILGGFVITWGDPWGACGSRGGGTGAMHIIDLESQTSGNGPWPPPVSL